MLLLAVPSCQHMGKVRLRTYRHVPPYSETLNLFLEEEHIPQPIELFSADANEYRSDILRKVIPLIANPKGKCKTKQCV